jgi:dephospho-CoA kinase
MRRDRLKESRGYSDEKIDGIFKSQLSREEFEKYCSNTIDNSKDINFTLRQLEKLL